ncbi:MAG: ABC transporter permease subunit [Saccharofermentans sp.]|nr:ABC transporter permease subunit [Saccharofermentans sp.]
MRKVFTVFKWEVGKLFSSWRRTFTLFLLPAVFLVGMLNLFPILLNYLSTGTLNKMPVTVVNAPDSFMEFIDDTLKAKSFRYNYMTDDEFDSFTKNKNEFRKQLRKGMIICLFDSGVESRSFDEEIVAYYEEVSKDNTEAVSNAVIYVAFDANSYTAQTRSETFKEAILKEYQNSLIDKLGGDYSAFGSALFETDSFNPVTDFLDYRTVANNAASRVVSGVLMIMMYYSTYSLVIDMFASERDRGFMDKLILTPVSRKKIYAGKILAINVIVTFSTCVTMALLFLSSWLNRNNDAMSLLPFGMMLTPSELLIVIGTIPVTVFLMTSICVSTVFSLKNLEDITINLQLPLIYFLGDFFIQMFRGTRPITLEYFVPVHNSLQLIAETFMAQDKAWHVIMIYLLNSALALGIFAATFRKEERK